MLKENTSGSFNYGTVTEDDQSLVEAHWRIINEKMGWSFRFYRVVSKWTQLINGENIFYHMLADRYHMCEVNFYKSLQGGIDVQVTFGAMGWGRPRSSKLTEQNELTVLNNYQPAQPNHTDYILVLASTDVINEAIGWTCKKYHVVNKWVQKFIGCENIFYNLYGDNDIENKKCSVNFLLASKEIKPRITSSRKGWIDPTKDFSQNRAEKQDRNDWLPSPVTPEDQILLQLHRKELNQRLGWNCKVYTAKAKWTESLLGGTNYFYHMLGDNSRERPCSAIFHKDQDGKITLQNTWHNWITPRQNSSSNQFTQGPVRQKVNQGDLFLVKKHIPVINKVGGWNFQTYTPVDYKWIQLLGEPKYIFYNMVTETKFQCSAYFLGDQRELSIQAYPGWQTPPRKH